MPAGSSRASTEPKLALRAIIDHRLHTFPITDGMTIGSDPACNIRIADACPVHIRIGTQHGLWRIYPADAEVNLRDYMNVECAWLPLNTSTVIAVGTTIFDCVKDVELEPDPEPPLDRQACPRCRASLVAVDLAAQFCPHCGGPLPADCPPWPIVATDAPATPEPQYRWWMLLMPHWLRAHVVRDPLFFARPTTVLAYINTLFNLGLKHEAGINGDRHLGEAMRYYRKAAHLGSLPARARLKAKNIL